MPNVNPVPGIPDIESPFFEEIFAEKNVSREGMEVARSLHSRGYAVIDFPEPELDQLAEDLVRNLDGLYDWEAWRAGRVPSLRITDAWKELEGALRIATNFGSSGSTSASWRPSTLSTDGSSSRVITPSIDAQTDRSSAGSCRIRSSREDRRSRTHDARSPPRRGEREERSSPLRSSAGASPLASRDRFQN